MLVCHVLEHFKSREGEKICTLIESPYFIHAGSLYGIALLESARTDWFALPVQNHHLQITAPGFFAQPEATNKPHRT